MFGGRLGCRGGRFGDRAEYAVSTTVDRVNAEFGWI